MLDQADKLRQLVQETMQEHSVLQPGPPVVAVSGGRRGVGTSTIATKLAQQLSELGKRIVLVDATFRAAGLAHQLSAEAGGSIGDVLSGKRSAMEVLVPVGQDVQLLPGADVAVQMPEMNHRALRRLIAEFRRLSSVADLVVIDAGSGMSPWVERLWTAAMQVLLVATPDSGIVKASYSTAKMAPWGDIDGKLRLVINRCDDPNLARRVSDSFAATCKRFLGMKLLGEAAVVARDTRLEQGDLRHTCTSQLHRGVRLLAADVLSQSLVIQSQIPRPSAGKYGGRSQAAALFCAGADAHVK